MSIFMNTFTAIKIYSQTILVFSWHPYCGSIPVINKFKIILPFANLIQRSSRDRKIKWPSYLNQFLN